MHALGLLLSLLLTQAPAGAPALQLRASTLQPYIGQEITLTLELQVPAGATAAPELTIPWRTREFGFNWTVPPAEWLRQHADAQVGLALSLPEEMTAIRAEAMPPASDDVGQRYRLQWRQIVNEADTLNRGPIVFAPVRMKLGQVEVVSNSLALERRKLPLMPAGISGPFLGIGDFQLQLDVPASAVVNAAAPFVIRVTGTGALARVPRPTPGELWNASMDFRLESVSEKPAAGAKVFAFDLHPRRSGALTLPAFRYVCFDAERGEYVSRTAGPWTVQVSAGASRTDRTDQPAPYPADAIPDRLRPVPMPAPVFAKTESWVIYLLVSILLAGPPLFFLTMVLLGRLGKAALTPPQRVARQVVRTLQKLGPQSSADRVLAELHTYLHARFGIPSGEMTPVDVEEVLATAGVPVPLVIKAREIFAVADAQRFGETYVDKPPLALRVADLILQLEADQSCS